MTQQKFCQSCSENDSCQQVYQQLGSVKGPSVVVKALFAFLLPLTVFIVALAASERFLAQAIESDGLRTILSLLLAVLTAFFCVLVIRTIDAQRRNKC